GQTDPIDVPARGPGPGAAAASTAFWILVGTLVGFGVAGILSIGIFLLAAAAVLFAIGIAIRPIDNRGVPAMLVGAALAPCLVAWWNRSGPGEFCRPDGCSEQLDPRPWGTVGIVLLLAGIALTWYTLRRPRPGTR
ncbi:MAG: hypothetical protein KIT69_18190, partial [Propionibacteriaceae bacterium]|nr:hypothetical protein [Propionibacteriaceae bacterium]